MPIKTSEEAKELFDKAMELSDEDITILKEINDFGELSAIRLAGRLLIGLKATYVSLSQLQEKGLVTKVQLAKRAVFESEEDQYFALSEEGQAMMNILPLVENMRGAS